VNRIPDVEGGVIETFDLGLAFRLIFFIATVTQQEDYLGRSQSIRRVFAGGILNAAGHADITGHY